MEYFSAEEALNKSRSVKNETVDKVLTYIFSCIEKQTITGDTCVFIPLYDNANMNDYFSCSLRVKTTLETLGYKVKEIRSSIFNTRINTLFISWLNPKTIISGFRCLG